MIRMQATDWDRDIVDALNDYLQILEPDPRGLRPFAYMDEPMLHSVGIHVAPLDGYAKSMRDAIAAECLRIRRSIALNLTFAQNQPYKAVPE